MEQELVPGESPPTPLGQIRIGALNVEKTNVAKLEQLVCLAASRGWERTNVSECSPTSARNQQPTQQCRHWKWKGWEPVHTNMVGILLNPGRSAIWHAFRAPKHRSRTERVLSMVLPRGPSALPNSKPPS